MRFSLLLAALLTVPTFADEVKSGTVYDNCTPKSYGFAEPAYKLDSEGDLNFNPKDKRIISWDAKKGILVYQDFWAEDVGKNDAIPKNKLHMKKEGGRPASLELFYDTEVMKKSMMMMPPASKDFPLATSFTTTFDYKDNKCSVKQMIMNYDNGKKTVTYDAAVCNKLLKVMKTATYKKLHECKGAFAKLNTILQDFNKELSEEDKELGMGTMGGAYPVDSADSYLKDKDWLALSAVSGCSMIKSMYGEQVDMGEVGYAFAPFGGGAGGLGVTGKADENKDAKDAQ